MLALVGIALIGWLDYLTGYELRMFPFYFAPVAYATAERGRLAGVVLAAVSALVWFGSNELSAHHSHIALLGANAALHFVACAWVAILIARLGRLAAAERESARSDALTGLPNQRGLFERVELELARLRRGRGPLVIACLDLDHFKEVNDRDGHAAGDRLLRVVGDRLRGSLRGADLAARIGGDEFVLVLPETTRDQARVALDRARAAIADGTRELGAAVTASLGAVIVDAHTDTPAAVLLARADEALYRAKHAGRDRVELAT